MFFGLFGVRSEGDTKDPTVKFEELQRYITGGPSQFLISTYTDKLVIKGTLADEETVINDLLDSGDSLDPYRIVLYGRNCTDPAPRQKAELLRELGFQKVRIYAGGMFEWCLLHEIYGPEEFPLTGGKNDPLLFK